MKALILIHLAVISGALFSARQVAAADEKTPTMKPNIVIFLADDAGWRDYGHSGNKQAVTPNIDSLAKSGVSLDRFDVCPVCAPTRAEFLTGRYVMDVHRVRLTLIE